MPQMRDSDRVPLDDSIPVAVKFSRVIPTWQVVMTIGALLAGAVTQGVVIYYGLQDQVKESRLIKDEQRDMKADMREIKKALDAGTIRGVEIGFELATLKQRVNVLEARAEARSR